MSDETPLSLAQARETKLAALRETIDAAIKRGGSHSDAEFRAAIKARLTQLAKNR